MGNLNDSLSEVFDIEIDTPNFNNPTEELENLPTIRSANQISLPEEVPERSKDEEDFEFARANLRDIAEKGKKLLSGITAVAESSDHPRAYEVAAATMKTLAEVNKDLLNLRKTHKETKNIGQKTAVSPETPQQNITVDKAVFVGTPAQLLEKRRQRNAQGS